MDRTRILELKHVQERLNSLKLQDLVSTPPKGWINFLRVALGMSSKSLAKRLNISTSTMSETEKAEREEAITLKRLRKIGESMNCDLVYYFLPREPIKETMEKRARYLAEEYLRNKHKNDLKKISKDLMEYELNRETEELMYSKKLWND